MLLAGVKICPTLAAAQADSNQTLLHQSHVPPEIQIFDRS